MRWWSAHPRGAKWVHGRASNSLIGRARRMSASGRVRSARAPRPSRAMRSSEGHSPPFSGSGLRPHRTRPWPRPKRLSIGVWNDWICGGRPAEALTRDRSQARDRGVESGLSGAPCDGCVVSRGHEHRRAEPHPHAPRRHHAHPDSATRNLQGISLLANRDALLARYRDHELKQMSDNDKLLASLIVAPNEILTELAHAREVVAWGTHQPPGACLAVLSLTPFSAEELADNGMKSSVGGWLPHAHRRALCVRIADLPRSVSRTPTASSRAPASPSPRAPTASPCTAPSTRRKKPRAMSTSSSTLSAWSRALCRSASRRSLGRTGGSEGAMAGVLFREHLPTCLLATRSVSSWV